MKEKGASLIESLMIIVAVSVIVFLMANLPNAMGLIQKSRHLSLAREIAAKNLEDMRSISYINLVNGTTSVSNSEISLLPKGSGEILVEDCPEEICTNSETIKHVRVTINWADNQKTQTISLDTFIGEGGLNQ